MKTAGRCGRGRRRTRGAAAAVPALLAGVLLLAAPPAQGAERVTLTNGFGLTCDHQQAVNGKVRLYTGRGEDNFLEVDAAQVASVQFVPDAAPPVEPSRAGAVPASLAPEDLRQVIARAGAAHDLDVALLASVVHAESGGNARAVSRAGAQGLMQLMPATAAALGVHDSFRAEDNVNGGTAYLDALLRKYHENLALALAAYNAGPAAVDKYHGIPPYRETRAYVARVIRGFNARVERERRARSRERAHSGTALEIASASRRTQAGQ